MSNLTDHFQIGLTAFSAMIFVVWVLPGLLNKKGKFPEDLPLRK